MITIARFEKVEDAHLLRIRLESGGVRAWVLDENLTQLGGILSAVADSGARVQIAGEDMELARAILAGEADEIDGLAPDDALAEPDFVDPDEPPPEAFTETSPPCPRCLSSDTTTSDRVRWSSFLSILLLEFSRPFARDAWKCCACGHSWR